MRTKDHEGASATQHQSVVVATLKALARDSDARPVEIKEFQEVQEGQESQEVKEVQEAKRPFEGLLKAFEGL